MSTLHLYVNTSSIEIIPTPPNTPRSNNDIVPHSNFDITTKYSVKNTIKNAGYTCLQRIGETLQGSVWKVSNGLNTYIIKITNKDLHKQSVTYIKGESIKIPENILKETLILKYLSEHNPPQSLPKYIDFFCDKYNYFLVQEYGGDMSLFDFVKQCHQFIEKGIISIKEWQSLCKVAMKQIVDLVDWLHNTMHCCHLDISLENFVIDNVMVTQYPHSKQISFDSDFQIKLIDFGVAKVFDDKNGFQYSKYVGKQIYNAPEVYSRNKIFDARSADCWSLGVVFFMMVTGSPPFTRPCGDDDAFNAIMNGYLSVLLDQWNRLEYTTPIMLNLMDCFFQNEKYRVNIKDIKKHLFLL